MWHQAIFGGELMKLNNLKPIFLGLVLFVAAITLGSCGQNPNQPPGMSEGKGSYGENEVGITFLRSDSTFDPNLIIDFEQSDLEVKYGEYGEIDFALRGPYVGPITWEISYGGFPAGLDLEDTNLANVIMFGTVLFTEQWCSALTATTAESKFTTVEICWNSEKNKKLHYAKFKTRRYLPFGVKNRLYQERIKIDLDGNRSIVGELDDGDLPFSVDVIPRNDKKDFLIKGRNNVSGVYWFALKVTTEREVETYKQFQISFKTGGGNTYHCPPGYYYDRYHGYCVQDRLGNCPKGHYYEPISNTCAHYPRPPSHVHCRPGHYYDHHINRCVHPQGKRCPINYHYSHYNRHCVPSSHFCPVGTRYSHVRRRCVSVWSNVCRTGYHYDSHFRKCVRNHHACGHSG